MWKFVTIGVLAAFGLAQFALGQTTITTVAGGPGEGPTATAIALRSPRAIAADSVGSVYIADTESQRIRKVTAAGVISVVAGNGVPGFSGDGGPAVAAQLRDPTGVAVDSAGNVYIADMGNHRIRRVTSGGVISTLTGGTTDLLSNPAGVAVDGAGMVYIADTENHRIRRFAGGVLTTIAGTGGAGFAGDGGPATSAMLWNPRGVAVDAAGNVYIADRWNRRIRRVAPNGTIDTIAGNGTMGFSGDNGNALAAQFGDVYGVSIDLVGGVYVADASNHRIRRVSEGGITTIAGNGNPTASGDGGSATTASLYQPYGVAADIGGSIYIADTSNFRIRAIAPGGVIRTMAGTGTPGFSGDGLTATSAQLFNPTGATVDLAGNLYVADTDNHRVRRVSPAGTVSTVAGNGGIFHSGDGGQATAATLYRPSSVAVDAAGNLYIADTFNNRVRLVTPGGVISTLVGGGTSPANGIAATTAQLLLPSAVAVDAAGNLYVADATNRIRRVAGGVITTIAGTGNYGFAGDGGSALAAELAGPTGLALDTAGNVYLADGSRIRRFLPGGVITTLAGSTAPGSGGDGGGATAAGLNYPVGLAVSSTGLFYIADSGNNRLREVNAAGVIRTVAGTGVANISGDGGDPTAATLYDPRGVAIDNLGRVYVVDMRNQRIRRLTVTAATSFTTVPAGLLLNVNGVPTVTPFSLSLAAGTNLTVEAPVTQGPPGTRASFTGWTDGGPAARSIIIGSEGAAYLANYATQYLVTTLVNPAAGGSLTPGSASPDGFYPAGGLLALTATTASGFVFSGFTGDLTGSTNPQNILLNGPRTVIANFTCTYQLSASTANVAAAAASASLTVSTGTGCAIPVTSGVSWLSVTVSGATVTYSFAANTGPARGGILTIGGQLFTVNQAIGPSLLTPSARDGGPIAPTGSTQTIVARYSHPAGVANLGVVNILINSALDGGNACYIAYSRPAGVLFLVNDGGTDSGLSAPLFLGSAASVNNSQCAISGTGSSAVDSGNAMTLTLVVTFSNRFRGNRVIYLAAQSVSNVTSGWQTMGVAVVTEASTLYPRSNAISPSTSTAASQTLTVTYQDSTSAHNLLTAWVLMNTAVDAGQACYIAYYVPGNLLFLYPDSGDGSQATAIALSGTNTIENSYCRIQAQGSSAVLSGNLLTLTLNYLVKPAFSGPRGIWAAVQTLTAQTSPWKPLGAWLVPP